MTSRRARAAGRGTGQIREEASAGGVSDLAPRAAAGAPMSGPVQPPSADVWRRAGAAAPAPSCSRAPTGRRAVRLRSHRALKIKPSDGPARYSGAKAVLTSQVPEVARGASATPARPPQHSQRYTRRTPIVLHQVLW